MSRSGRENKSHWQLWAYVGGREVDSNRLEIHSFEGKILSGIGKLEKSGFVTYRIIYSVVTGM